jgi:integrase
VNPFCQIEFVSNDSDVGMPCDAVGTPIAVQPKLMRHSDIRTTMNIYGDVVTDEMGQAHSKVVGLARSGPA